VHLGHHRWPRPAGNERLRRGENALSPSRPRAGLDDAKKRPDLCWAEVPIRGIPHADAIGRHDLGRYFARVLLNSLLCAGEGGFLVSDV
jgi:hypothetical protein